MIAKVGVKWIVDSELCLKFSLHVYRVWILPWNQIGIMTLFRWFMNIYDKGDTYFCFFLFFVCSNGLLTHEIDITVQLHPKNAFHSQFPQKMYGSNIKKLKFNFGRMKISELCVSKNSWRDIT